MGDVSVYASGGIDVITTIITDVGSVFTAIWTFLSGNWGLFIFIALPIFVFILASVIGIFVHR